MGWAFGTSFFPASASITAVAELGRNHYYLPTTPNNYPRPLRWAYSLIIH